MVKKIIILVLIAAVLLFAAWFFFARKSSLSQAPNSGVIVEFSNGSSSALPIPAVANFPGAPQGDTFVLGTPSGSVTLKNFYKLPLVIDEEFLILENTDDYQITYDTEANQFFIYASSSPLSAARAAGETAFLAMLGISRDDACKLNVAEGYPRGVSSTGLGTTLSFCATGAFESRQ
jgi:hypothetical protein